MTPEQNKLMDQCRAEAEAEYPTDAESLRNLGYNEDAVWRACTERAATRSAYAQALYSERSKGLLTVEDVMDCIEKWRRHDTRNAISAEEAKEALENEAGVAGWLLLSDLRSRLTSAANKGLNK